MSATLHNYLNRLKCKSSKLMKNTFITLLAAFMAIPAYAAPLNPDDWTFDKGSEGEYIFNDDGTMTTTGNVVMYYAFSEQYEMVNGSGLSITLQFVNPSTVPDGGIFVYLYNDASHTDTTNFFVVGQVMETELYIYHGNIGADMPSVTPGNTSTITLNYAIENEQMLFSYALNGITRKTENLGSVGYNTFWIPAFRVTNDTTPYTITDVSFTMHVPEPTTATLSLLALAGLVARRRRASR